MELGQLKRQVYNKYLTLLSVYRFLDTTIFSAAFNKASNSDKEIALKYVDQMDLDRLEVWAKNILINNQMYEYLDVRTLRMHCGRVGLSNFSRHTKEQLISLIHYYNDKRIPKSGVAYEQKEENTIVD